MNSVNAKDNAKQSLKGTGGLPDLLNYTNYRQFLKDYYLARKQADPRFSLRSLAMAARFPSHGLLQYLMDGERNLSKKTLVKLSLALGLDKERTQYFENLVFFNQAKTLEEKGFFYDKLVRSNGKSTFKKLDSSQLQAFRRWYTIAIREMLNLEGFRGNAAWITGRLLPPVQTYESEEALALLLETGLIKKTANGYKAADPDITTEDEVKSFLVKNYHAQMIRLAGWAQDEVAVAERDVSSVTFAIKESELPALKKQLQLMRKELRAFAAEPGTADRIVQVNMQMFPLTKAK
ncbi:MAG: TIGR02147 family protein [Fibrobacteres bacterium]|nr:TIGR02147 family protein [Fibrobacterota bacterium]